MVLDFDLRRPGLATILDQSPRQSMSDAITGRVSFAEHALRFRDNLLFGLNRSSVRHASELLQSRSTVNFLAGIDATYRPDIVLFDMPPVLAADDALGFLHQVDAALIVVAAERTPLSQVEKVEAQVAELTAVLGVVLNRCNYTDRSDYGYY
jgi:Mrp family chromosome partitioning ATPase